MSEQLTAGVTQRAGIDQASLRNQGSVVNQNQNQYVQGDQINYLQTAADQHGSNETEQMVREREDCLRALLATDPKETRESLRSRKGGWTEGTCKWVLDKEEVVSWLRGDDSTPGIFWLHGSPGTGKSTICLFLVDELEKRLCQQEQMTLTYFFCDASSVGKRSATIILRGIIYQLCDRHPSLLDKYLLKEYRIKRDKLWNLFHSLWDILIAMGKDKATGHKYCVIDALDECDEKSRKAISGQLEWLYNTSQNSDDEPRRLHFLVSSRPDPQIHWHLNAFLSKDIALFDEMRQDLQTFIDDRISQLVKRKGYPSALAKEISEGILAKAGGTFLWVGLVCAELNQVSANDALELLERLPKGLDLLYRNLLDKALSTAKSPETLKNILTFVATCLTPVSLGQISIACSLFKEKEPETRDFLVKDMVEPCSLMIIVNRVTVRLLHKSVKDFFFAPTMEGFPTEKESHAEMAYRCLDHLLNSFEGSQLGATRDVREQFVVYAAEKWAKHASLAQEKFVILPRHRQFFGFISELREAWLDFLLTLKNDAVTLNFTIFHVAAHWGIQPIVDYVKDRHFLVEWAAASGAQSSIDQIAKLFDQPYANPLRLVAASEHVDVLRALLDLRFTCNQGVLKVTTQKILSESNSDEWSQIYRFPVTEEIIGISASNTKMGSEAMKLICNERKDEFLINGRVLREIFSNQNQENGISILKMLLEQYPEHVVMTRAQMYSMISNQTCGAEMMGLLIRHIPKSIKVTQKLIHTAIENFDRVTVNTMVKHLGEEFKVTDNTARSAAANQKYGIEIMRSLLQSPKANISHTDEMILILAEKFDPSLLQRLSRLNKLEPSHDLIRAAASNQTHAVQVLSLLIELGGGTIIDNDILETTVSNPGKGYQATEYILRNFKDKINVTSDILETALTENGNDAKLISLLLDHLNHDIHLTDDVLYSASISKPIASDVFAKLIEHEKCHVTLTPTFLDAIRKTDASEKLIMSALEDNDIKIDANFASYETMLKKVVRHFSKDVLHLLLQRITSKSAVTDIVLAAAIVKSDIAMVEMLLSHQTPSTNVQSLQLAAARALPEVFNLLLDHGATLDDRGGFLDNILQAAAFGGNPDMIQTILNHDVNVNMEGGFFGTALTAACHQGHRDVIERLLDSGADVNLRAGYYSSPLQAAVFRGHMRVVHLLIDNGADLAGHELHHGGILQAAVCTGSPDMLYFLLENGAEVNFTLRTHFDGPKTVYRYGTAHTMKKRLRELDVEWDSIYNERGSPLHAAISKNDPYSTRILLDHGADPSLKCAIFSSALHEAIYEKCDSIVQLLLRRTAPFPDETFAAYDDYGDTCMHDAATQGDLHLCRALHNAGADFRALDERNRSVLSKISNHFRKEDIIKWLLSIGASVHGVDSQGWSAFEWALQNHLDVPKLLHKASADVLLSNPKYGTTPLDCAAWNGNFDAAKWLLTLDSNINARDLYGDTVLHCAAMNDDVELANLLYDAGADPLARNTWGRSVLSEACRSGSANVVEWLLAMGADPHSRDSGGGSNLYMACFSNLRAAKMIYKTGVGTDHRTDDRSSLFHAAATKKRLDILKWLVSINAKGYADEAGELQRTPMLLLASSSLKGCKLLRKTGCYPLARSSSDGETALHVASKSGQLDIVKWLLRLGAHPNARDNHERTSLHFAAANNFKVLKCLVRAGGDTAAVSESEGTLLHAAALGDSGVTVEWLIKQGLDVNAKTENGITPLHIAVQIDLVVSQTLFQVGADLDAIADGETRVLHKAAAGGKAKIVEWLIERGAEVDVRDAGKYTPMHLAASVDLKTTQALFEARADIEACSQNGRTILHQAALGGETDVMEWLIKQGISVTTKDAEACTPLHLAARNADLEGAKKLHEAGADISVLDANGSSVLSYAVLGNKVETVRWLLSLGADIHVQDASGILVVGHSVQMKRPFNLFKMLYQAGSGIISNRPRNQTILHSAVRGDNEDFIRWLLNESAHDDGIASAVESQNDDLMRNPRLLLEFQDREGISPLHHAIYCRQRKTAELLIQNHAGADVPDNYGLTARCILSRIPEYESLASLLPSPKEDTLLEQDFGKLVQSTREWIEDLIQNPDPIAHQKYKYSSLGTCLLHLNWRNDSRLAFELGMKPELDDRNKPKVFTHEYMCDSCDKYPLTGPLHMCTFIWCCCLCDECHNEREGRPGLPCCENHEFISIDEYTWTGQGSNAVNRLGETYREWLERLKREISDTADAENGMSLPDRFRRPRE